MPKRDPGAFRGTSEEPLRCLRGEAPLKAPGIAAVLMCQHFLVQREQGFRSALDVP